MFSGVDGDIILLDDFDWLWIVLKINLLVMYFILERIVVEEEEENDGFY